MNMLRRAILAAALFAGLTPAFAQAPAPVPALPDTERRVSYSISGTTCSCAVNFALYGDGTDFQNWVEVFINGSRVDYNDSDHGWTITSPSGSLGSLARPITNAVLTFNAVQTGTIQIVGARRPRRSSQFTENAGVSARNLNQVFTDIISQNREIWDKTNDMTGRAVLGLPGETIGLLPAQASRASKFFTFDSSGNPSVTSVTPGLGNVIGPGSSVIGNVPVWASTNGTVLGAGGPVRTGLSGSPQFYVDGTLGNDSNACTGSGALACKTLNGVVSVIRAFDLSFTSVNVTVAAGTYAGMSCLNPWVGYGSVTFIGDTTTPTNVVVAGGTSSAFDIENGCSVSLKGFSVSSTALQPIQAVLYGRIVMSKMDLGATPAGLAAVYSTRKSYVEINDNNGATSIHTGIVAGFLLQATHGGELRVNCTTACLSFSADATYTYTAMAQDGAIIGTSAATFALNAHVITANTWQTQSFGTIQWNGNSPPLDSDFPGTTGTGSATLGTAATGPTVYVSGGPGAATSFLMIPGGTSGVCFRKQDNSVSTFCVDNTGAPSFPLVPLPLTSGGTNASLTASNGGIFYSTASAGAILAGTATARQMLQSGTSAAPAWSTATWPATTTINQILYSSAANTVTGLASANSSILVTNGSGVPSLSTTLPAFTLGGAVSGGGNNVDNIIIGASTPLAGTFTTLATTVSGPAVTNSQNAVTQGFTVTNTNAGASAAIQDSFAVTNAGTFKLTANSTAAGAFAIISWSGSGGTFFDNQNASGSMTFRTGATPSNALELTSGQNVNISAGNVVMQVATKTLVLKQGANGTVGTFVCNGATPVTVSNTNVAINDGIGISLNTVGGTVGAQPSIKTITASTGFTVACTASDTSTMNYWIIKNAA